MARYYPYCLLICNGCKPFLDFTPILSDRMLVTQSIVESMPLLSNDGLICRYQAEVLW